MQEQTLIPFGFWLKPCSRTAQAGDVQQAMADHLDALGHPGAEPLRWAITVIDAQRGLRVEGIGLHRSTEAVDLPGYAATTTTRPRPQDTGNTSPGEAG
jgi:hypothetical protein